MLWREHLPIDDPSFITSSVFLSHSGKLLRTESAKCVCKRRLYLASERCQQEGHH